MKNTNISVVQETNIGLYVWELPSGEFLSDGGGNLLNIPARQGDIQRMARITAVARNLGFGDGIPRFIPDVRRVSQMEWEDQKNRLLNGEEPDELNPGVIRDSIRAKQRNR